ncbi:hypothetical protein COK69_26730, partial [Bacillus cereus]
CHRRHPGGAQHGAGRGGLAGAARAARGRARAGHAAFRGGVVPGRGHLGQHADRPAQPAGHGHPVRRTQPRPPAGGARRTV